MTDKKLTDEELKKASGAGLQAENLGQMSSTGGVTTGGSGGGAGEITTGKVRKKHALTEEELANVSGGKTAPEQLVPDPEEPTGTGGGPGSVTTSGQKLRKKGTFGHGTSSTQP